MEALSEKAAELRRQTALTNPKTGKVVRKPEDPPMTTTVRGGWTSYIESSDQDPKQAKR